MYFPLTIFDQEGWLLAATLRPGYQSEATTILNAIERIIAKLRARWRNVEIVLVVDGAFKSSTLLNWCEDNDVFYLAGYCNSAAVQQKVQPEADVVRREFTKRHGVPRFTDKHDKRKGQEEHTRIRNIRDSKERMAEEKALALRSVRLIGEDTHRATTCPKEDPDRRLIFRLDDTDHGLDTRCVLTNFTSYTAEQIYGMYCQRGNSENWIGELKSCCNIRFNSQSCLANQFRLHIHGMDYMLMWVLRLACPHRLANRKLESIRKILT